MIKAGFASGLAEVEQHWSLADLLDALDALEVLDEINAAQEEWAKAQKDP